MTTYLALGPDQQRQILVQRLAKLEADHFAQGVALQELAAAISALKKQIDGYHPPAQPAPVEKVTPELEPAPATNNRRRSS
jgi:hypothetical protein